MFLASATVHWIIMISSAMPRANEDTQIAGSGHNIASDNGESAMLAPISTTNRIGLRGLNRSDTTPPTISPRDSAPVITPQAAGPPRYARATAGPSTLNAPYHAISTTAH